MDGEWELVVEGVDVRAEGERRDVIDIIAVQTTLMSAQCKMQ